MSGPGNTHDVIISGGGVVGASLACALADAGLRVGLLDAREPVTDWPAGSIDQRVYAITCASQTLFERLGVWDGIRARGVSPYREMQVWDAAGPGRIHFDAAELGEPLLGHIIEQRVIQAALLARISHHPSTADADLLAVTGRAPSSRLDVVSATPAPSSGPRTPSQRHLDALATNGDEKSGLGQQARPAVERFCPAVLADFSVDDTRVTVRLEDGRELSAALLVGADGAGSRVRELAGVGVQAHDYAQTAVVAAVATERPHAETAWQSFLPSGPLAFLPLRDGRSSIVWSTTPEQAERLLALPETDFCIELGQAFDYRLGAITGVSARGGFPLRRLHAVDYVQQRLALVGDAAHVIHPLAGQGVNLGLLDVAALAEVVADTAAAGRDIGAHANLRRYERWRRADNALMQSAMDGFKWLFASQVTPVRLLRNLGLGTVDRLSPIKSLLARHAMGRAGDLPRLVRPDTRS